MKRYIKISIHALVVALLLVILIPILLRVAWPTLFDDNDNPWKGHVVGVTVLVIAITAGILDGMRVHKRIDSKSDSKD
jgi:hypothetical protein